QAGDLRAQALPGREPQRSFRLHLAGPSGGAVRLFQRRPPDLLGAWLLAHAFQIVRRSEYHHRASSLRSPAAGMHSADSFELADWRVEHGRGVVSREGNEFGLESKLMQLLLVFATSPGRVITKDEIVSRVWSGRAIGDDTLSAAISRLRTALGENKSKRYIE